MIRLRFLLLALVVSIAAAGARAQETWYTLHGPDDLFTIELPAKPDYDDQTEPNDDTFSASHSYSLDHGGGMFAVDVDVFRHNMDLSDARAILEAVSKGTAKALENRDWARPHGCNIRARPRWN